MRNIFKKLNNNLFAALAIVGIFSLGVYVGFFNQSAKNFAISAEPLATEADLSPFWKVWNTIDKKYPGASQTTKEERIYGAISGLVESLDDPYSVFLDPEEAKEFEESITGNFSGIGIEIDTKDKVLTVVAPIKDTPAYKAGLKAGDKILKIDDTVAADMPVEKAVKLIRGKAGTPVTLTILSEGEREPREVKIVRGVINVPTIETELRKDGIFVVKLFTFSENSSTLFRNAMQEFVRSKSKKLILDLRGNPGGYLNSAVDIASWFVPAGKTIVTEDYGNEVKKVLRSRGYNGVPKDIEFVVLVDGGSASASEIVAGALQDYGLADLVGEKTYGKGSVQELINVTRDTMLKITVAKWLTPNGKHISELGLTPDHVVELTRDDVLKKRDPQMDKAVNLIN